MILVRAWAGLNTCRPVGSQFGLLLAQSLSSWSPMTASWRPNICGALSLILKLKHNVKLLSDRCIRDFLVNDSTNQTTTAVGNVTTEMFLLFDLNCSNYNYDCYHENNSCYDILLRLPLQYILYKTTTISKAATI